jgi:hypothetical protein
LAKACCAPVEHWDGEAKNALGRNLRPATALAFHA